MDSSFPLDGFIYTSLYDLNNNSGLKSSSPITVWPSFDNTPQTQDQQQLLLHLQQQQYFPSLHQHAPNAEKAFPLVVPSTPSAFSSISSPCYPTNFNQRSDLNTKSANKDEYDICMADASVNYYDTAAMGAMRSALSNALEPSIAMSRSSSVMTCIDPTSLMLHSSSNSSGFSSPCLSGPHSRRNSFIPMNGIEYADMNESPMIESILQEDSLTLSSQSVAPTLACTSSECLAASYITHPYVEDFIMPDGTIYRFDGTSLMPVPSIHYSNVPSASSSCSSSSSLSSPLSSTSPPSSSSSMSSPPSSYMMNEPSLNSKPFVNSTLMHQALTMMVPPKVSLTDYLPMMDPSMLSAFLEGNMDSTAMLTRPASSTMTGAPAMTATRKKTSALKKSSKKVISPSVRRFSEDSAYSSSSSTIVLPQLDRFINTGSSGNDNSGACGDGDGGGGAQNKYRKDGAGEFQCPFENCSYRYNLRRELNRHRNVHLFAGKDKYRCMNCNSGLCRLDSVKRHMEAKGKIECLKKGLYQEFKENGELIRIRKCKPSWYEAAAANAAAAAMGTSTSTSTSTDAGAGAGMLADTDAEE
ncbi:hypothetical protein BX616_003859 [Lobosporangium transversale]|nr:hypothetical protein BX616_003859 [Lobosporangium transversale]